MEDQAEPGLFLPHDVRCEQRGLLRPGTSVEEESIRRGSNCLHQCFFPSAPPEPVSLILSLIPHGHVQVSSLVLARAGVPIRTRLRESRADANCRPLTR